MGGVDSGRRARTVLAIWLLLAVAPGRSSAEEGGVGHWDPGRVGFQAGMLPSQPGFYFKNLLNYYEGAASPNRSIPIGGKAFLNLRSFCLGDTLATTWVTPTRLFGGRLAAGIYVPVRCEASSGRAPTPDGGRSRESSAFGLGDIILAPLQVGWDAGPSHFLASVDVYAPTGPYSRKTLAPLGLNYWTVEPSLGYTYLDPRTGWEASAYVGYDFNTTNPATDYHTGSQAHFDWTVARHIRLATADEKPDSGGRPAAGSPLEITPGIGGWIYQQAQPDSGRGAILGAFRGRTLAVGPELQARARIGGKDVTLEFKILKEFAVKHRVEGVSSWFNLSAPL